MIRAARTAVRSPRSRAWLGLLLLLAYGAMLAHIAEPGHAETEAPCAICIATERLDDTVLDGGHSSPRASVASAAPVHGVPSVAPADAPVAISRGPPLFV